MKVLALFTMVAVFIAGCTGGQISNTTSEPTGMEHAIEITSTGFSPQMTDINVGDAVVFVNKDVAQHWPASDIHPTHTVYPGSSINECFSAKSEIFDACKGLGQGEEYGFVFTHSGNWCYHDHLHPEMTGCVDVK